MQPVMIRVYQGASKGATAFFRNRMLLQTLMDSLEQLDRRRLRIFVHAASVGAEPYSLALHYLHRKRSAFELEIHATDICAEFLAVAAMGEYPLELARGLTEEEIGWFERREGVLRIPEAAKSLVRFLPPMDFVRDRPEESFDAVLIMNALTYVTPEEQHLAIGRAAAYTDSLLALTAFHPDSIRADLTAAGFEPLLTAHEAIHLGWGDRLRSTPIDPTSSAYSWMLPPYDSQRPDFAYRYGSLFRRSG